MTQFERAVQKVSQADEVADLQHHIGWTDVILPKLERTKTLYSELMVAKVLGRADASPLTIEQLAGRVEGINEIIRLFTHILKDGASAIDVLQQYNFNLPS